jgi:2-polyprenyl-3-methyl-5-hydroxy-6-metoxy-1,4-benzoquinol methylase
MDKGSNPFRLRRFGKFRELIPSHGDVSVLDIGGTAEFWKCRGDLYRNPRVSITVVNLSCEETDDENIAVRAGNACSLPYPDNSFDVVHSNSVIEHVGDWNNMIRMAETVRRLAPAYFVQTPNFWFPIEPHFRRPLVHWLPEGAAIQALRLMRKSTDTALTRKALRSIRLIAMPQMRTLFPEADIWEEKTMGFTKSLVAIRRTDRRYGIAEQQAAA